MISINHKTSMKLSIVIPTRNRPDVLRYNLRSLASQDLTDYEIIVSDNGTDKLCKNVFDEITKGDERFMYVRPEKPLDIYKHHEFAIQFASGDYITILEDKKIFLSGALDLIRNLCERDNPNVISYDICAYYPCDGTLDTVENGFYKINDKELTVEHFNSEDEFRYMLKYSGYFNYIFRGNLLWGFYKRELVEEIRNILGGFFNKVYSFDSGLKFLAMYLSIGKECIHLDGSVIIEICAHGRGSKTNEYDFLFDTYNNEVPCVELKKTEVPGLDHMINSWYFVAQEYQWIINNLIRNKYDIGNYKINLAGVLARIYWSVYMVPLENIPNDVCACQKTIIQRSINKLDNDAKEDFYRILKKYYGFDDENNESKAGDYEKKNTLISTWNWLTSEFPILLELYKKTRISKRRERNKREKEIELNHGDLVRIRLDSLIQNKVGSIDSGKTN